MEYLLLYEVLILLDKSASTTSKLINTQAVEQIMSYYTRYDIVIIMILMTTILIYLNLYKFN
jgi:hypothetical protein